MDDGKANAINFEMIAALNAALDKAEADAKAIVLAGREGRFSGGFDLNAFATLGADGVYKLLDAGAELLLRLYGGPLPLVAACTGHAIAMGTFILHACDTRVGASGAFKIGANEAVTGMQLPIFAMELARDRLNPTHMTRAMIQGFIYDPAGALEAGYLDMLTDLDKVEASVLGGGRTTHTVARTILCLEQEGDPQDDARPDQVKHRGAPQTLKNSLSHWERVAQAWQLVA